MKICSYVVNLSYNFNNMKGKEVKSFTELKEKLRGQEYSYLLLYKAGSEQSECARANLLQAAGDTGVNILLADVNSVRDIHPQYNIDSVPSLIEFEKGELRNMVKGCHNTGYYKSLFNHAVFEMKAAGNGRPRKRVTVYSTPSCPWCNTLKTYLRKNGIRFSDIDVSRDMRAAEEMVRKSGQQGVPQTDINGTVIIGFDQKRINQLLEIKPK